MRLLGNAGLRRIFANHGNPEAVDEDDNDDTYGIRSRRRQRPKCIKDPYPPVPSEEGTRLMRSGTFGCTGSYQDILRKRNKRLARRLLSREQGVENDHLGTQEKIISQVGYLGQELYCLMPD